MTTKTKNIRLSKAQTRILVEVVTGQRYPWNVPVPSGRVLVRCGVMRCEYAPLGRNDYHPTNDGIRLCVERGWVAQEDVSPKVVEASAQAARREAEKQWLRRVRYFAAHCHDAGEMAAGLRKLLSKAPEHLREVADV